MGPDRDDGIDLGFIPVSAFQGLEYGKYCLCAQRPDANHWHTVVARTISDLREGGHGNIEGAFREAE